MDRIALMGALRIEGFKEIQREFNIAQSANQMISKNGKLTAIIMQNNVQIVNNSYKRKNWSSKLIRGLEKAYLEIIEIESQNLTNKKEKKKKLQVV